MAVVVTILEVFLHYSSKLIIIATDSIFICKVIRMTKHRKLLAYRTLQFSS